MPELDPDAAAAAAAPAPTAAPAPPAPTAARKLSLEERPLAYVELSAARAQLDPQELVLRLRDGRPIVRANAALGLAALGHTGGDLVPFLRDGDPRVALAAAEALSHLGIAQRGHLAAIAGALDGARPEVAEAIQGMFAELVGKADAELMSVLDSGLEVAASTVVRACERLGPRGLHLLQAAARDGRARVRINAVRGVGRLGALEQARSMAALTDIERGDEVSDVRAAATAALAVLAARARAEVAARHRESEPRPPAVPELERRALTPAELKAAAETAPLDELLRALEHPRQHARLNAVRTLAQQGPAAAPAAGALAVLLRDPEGPVRLEAAGALGALGPDALVAAPALVRALGDVDPAVSAAAEAVLAALGPAAAPALVGGFDVPGEPHGARIAALIGRLPDGPDALRAALASTSVDVRVHAALGLGALGKARAGAALLALSGAAADGNARLRAAAARAIAMIEPRPERRPPRIAVAGFEERELAAPELAAAREVLAAAGAAGLAAHLHDARAAVRANAARALGALGADALSAASALAVCLRDDALEVRLAAAQAIDRIGDAAVIAGAPDLVRALRGAEPALAAQLAAMLRARAHAAIDAALGRGLDTADPHHAEQICELLCARPAAEAILCEAFAHPPSQAAAARGLVRLGPERIGPGRALLEKARASSSAQERELARATLRALDGEPAAPEVPAVAGFETALLEPSAFTDPGKLDARVLLGFLQDGRPLVRANTATALGALGPAAAPLATTLGALLRDDDARVRLAVARALDRLGDAAVIAAAPHLVGALRGDAQVAAACRAVLAARKSQVEAALIAGLETSDEAHGMRVAELICALPDARELLFIAFDSPAQNVQINAALGIGLLGPERAGPAGRRRLVGGLAGPFTRRREAMVKALAMLGPEPPR